MSEDSHDVSSKRMDSDKDKHVFFKTMKEDNNTEVTNLTYKKMFKLIFKIRRENEELERIIVEFKDYIVFLK